MSVLTTYRGVRALVTGHTGFKGAWLCAWLAQLGAKVTGMALEPAGEGPNLYRDARLHRLLVSHILDIRDESALKSAMRETRPDIVFHLAAQSLVPEGYANPIATFSSNIMGTAHVLAAAAESGARAVVCVTTDKVYENKEWVWPYRESDRLGGKDPYSASKAAAEIVAGVYRDNIWLEGRGPALATARGGNVIGGGDWSKDRLIPDIVRFLAADAPIILRAPRAVRPWQHVLELARGYLVLGQHLLERPSHPLPCVNFGPGPEGEAEVAQVVRAALCAFGRPDHEVRVEPTGLLEAQRLRLDISRADALLGWRPRIPLQEGIELTMAWYRGFASDPASAYPALMAQIEAYQAPA